MAMEVFGSIELAAEIAPFVEFDEALALRGTARAVLASVGAAVLRWCADAYVCGGSSGSVALRSAERFSPAQGRWEALPPMLWPRNGATGAAVAGCLYVCGGCDGPVGAYGTRNLREAERFDPRRNCWEALPDMLEHRRFAVGVAIGRRLYVAGGEGGEDGEVVLSSAERYDPLMGAWEALPHMGAHRFGAAGAAVRGRLCVCGGSVGLDALRCAECLAPEAGGWEQLPEMREGRVGATAACVGGRLFVCGGGQVDRVLRSAECFCPDAGLWEPGPMLAEGFRSAGGIVVAGLLLVFGGQDQDCRGQQSVRSLDLERGYCEELPHMSVARMWPVALRVL